MLSVAKLTLGQEAYYEQQVARGLDDYYAGRGESPGIWSGSVSTSLGLVGVVGDGDLGTLLRGVNPAGSGRLREPVRARTITVRSLDLESGEWLEQSKRLSPVSGYDLVFSCPKSVSLVHALTDDEQVRREISEAHEASWQAALAYLEREACVVRRGRGGAVREHGEGFVAAAFRHRTSRAQDPHLHTHVIVANLTRTQDGQWRALDGEAVLKTYRLAAGYLYEAHLRNELSQRLGLEWRRPVKGMAELEGAPDEAVRAFSTRRQSLMKHMQAHGTHGFAASRVAALATREAKEQADLPRLREEWKARAAEHGLGRRDLEALVPTQMRMPPALDRELLGEQLFAPEGLTARQTTFSLPELVQAVANALPTGGSVDDVLGLADELSHLPGVETVDDGETPGRPKRFTTRELIEIERAALARALAPATAEAVDLDVERVSQRLARSGWHLSEEQRRLVLEASMSADRVVCVAGVAGSGKTRALGLLADVYADAGVPVLGAAPSGRAAEELERATGILSRTLHRLLLDSEREGGLPSGCLLVVDEAGMAETRVLAPLLRLVADAGGKALLVGDPGQLPSVGAGGLYAALCERLGTIELTTNQRQHDPVEREALAELRAGNPEPYLAHATRSDALKVDEDPVEAKRRLVRDWWEVAHTDPQGAVILAYHRADVRDLNAAAHRLMLDHGLLGPESITVGDREFRVGDRILCRRNHLALGVRNGTRGTIMGINGGVLTVSADGGECCRLSPEYALAHLEHGYALSGHAAQGATVDHAFVLLRDEGALREWGYVACSRARVDTRLYLASREEIEPSIHTPEPDPAPSVDRAARALERPAAEPLAVEQVRPLADSAALVARELSILGRQHQQANQRLNAAARELERLHWWKGGAQRLRLQTEIDLFGRTLATIDERRAQLERNLAGARRIVRPAEQRHSRDQALRVKLPSRRARTTEPPTLGLER